MMLVRYEHLHSHISGDHDHLSPQKFHINSVCRIGGLAILLSLILGGVLKYFLNESESIEILILAIASLPAFLVGFAEDTTKRAGIRIRFLGICISSILVGLFFNTWVESVGIEIFDFIFLVPLIPVVFTVFAICGLTNAYNIIDGFNGLASMVAILTLISLCYVGFKCNDSLIVILTLVPIGAILGFFFWNYPKGLIFLGDGGAYLIGFWIAFVSIFIVTRNHSVSPFYALLVNAYPVVETIFTIWRRSFHKNKNPSLADDMHLHTLIYRRAITWDEKDKGKIVSNVANARTSPYLWLLASAGIIPASLFWNFSPILITFFVIFCFLYLLCFLSIIKFKVPKWLK